MDATQPRQEQSMSATKKSTGLSAEERSALKERAQELKTEERRGSKSRKADGESDVLAKIAEMPDADREIAERLHEIVTASAPNLSPKTWYGMPGYAKDGKVVVFFQSADKFSSRYATLGFNDNAQLDKGPMWPTAFAVTKLTAAVEKEIAALVKKAAG
jgi:uncharacterized protein YdhG (YjbR/CyaY superfamily)